MIIKMYSVHKNGQLMIRDVFCFQNSCFVLLVEQAFLHIFDQFFLPFLGSTDLKEGEIIDRWAEADPEYQISKGKYSLAAKISMDDAALKFGELHPDIRIVIFNPSMIVGPMFHPDMHGSLVFFKDILTQGDKMKDIPDDSMSFIDVRDLAQLELAALENKNAKGTYIFLLL